jgi:hypothetical protein
MWCFLTAIFYVILYVQSECLYCFLSLQAWFVVSVSTVHSECIFVLFMFFVIFVWVRKFLHGCFPQLPCFYCVPSRYLLCLCAFVCWFYLLCLLEIVCRFSTNASNFDEHRRCELKCNSICGFAAACGGQEEFFQIILCRQLSAPRFFRAKSRKTPVCTVRET